MTILNKQYSHRIYNKFSEKWTAELNITNISYTEYSLLGKDIVLSDSDAVKQQLREEKYAQYVDLKENAQTNYDKVRDIEKRSQSYCKGRNRHYINLNHEYDETRTIPKKDIIKYEISPTSERVAQSGHGGSDYNLMDQVINRINGDETADIIDYYEACDMFLPGMFAYRSMLNGGIPMEIPNLRDKAVREQYRNDTMCTDPEVAGDMLMPCYHKGNPDIPDSTYERIRKMWDRFAVEEKERIAQEIKEMREAKENK